MTEFGTVLGQWWLRSASDPRWNKEGRGEVGGINAIPPVIRRVISQLEAELGPPPKDLEWEWWSDSPSRR